MRRVLLLITCLLLCPFAMLCAVVRLDAGAAPFPFRGGCEQQESAAQSQSATSAPIPPIDTPQQQISIVLHEQVLAWNNGDLKGYMDGYWNSPELTFFSGGTITKGWQPTLDRYRERYQSGGREMGKLEFTDLSIEMLGPDSAVARGRWRLKMKNGEQPHGLFTVVFRKFPDGWRIIHDHSSAE